jgi:hypothetical protein
MSTCCCSLAGTAACITCSNRPWMPYNIYTPWNQPLQPSIPIPNKDSGWKCPECGQVWSPLVNKCDCKKKEKSE